MQQILIRESIAKNYIYMYKVDDYWFAYERSAFYLYSICSVDHIFQYFDARHSITIAIAVLKNNKKNLNPQFEIVEDTADQLILSCGIICKGFSHWKNLLDYSSNRDTYIKKIISDHNHLISKEMDFS